MFFGYVAENSSVCLVAFGGRALSNSSMAGLNPMSRRRSASSNTKTRRSERASVVPFALARRSLRRPGVATRMVGVRGGLSLVASAFMLVLWCFGFLKAKGKEKKGKTKSEFFLF